MTRLQNDLLKMQLYFLLVTTKLALAALLGLLGS